MICRWCKYANENVHTYNGTHEPCKRSLNCECKNHRGSTDAFNKIYTNFHHGPMQ